MSNDRPIVGVLCMDISQKLVNFGEKYKSYIDAAYVKYLESAGARVVPVWIGRSESYYHHILHRVNGLLIPGGAVFFDSDHPPNLPNKCVKSSEIVYKIVGEMYKDGRYFPLWGTCIGFELILYHSAFGEDIRRDCSTEKCSLPLEFENDFKTSKMFKDLPKELETIMRNEKVFYHIHKYCVTKQDLNSFRLTSKWRVTGVNRDADGQEFISTIEHKDFPIYGCQFHPEKPPYTFNCDGSDKIPHSPNAIKCSQYFAHFFVGECRRNWNRFESPTEEIRHLIYNFPITYTKLSFLQCYLFEESVDYPKEDEVGPQAGS